MKHTKGRVTIDVWDNGGRTIDRFTIAISGLQSYGPGHVRPEPITYFMGASSNPFYPQGFGQHSHEIKTADYFPSRYTHLGHRIDFLDLPADVQRFIRSELQMDPDNNRVRDVISHVRDIIRETPDFDDPDGPVNGLDLVDTFGAWRANAVDLLAELDKGGV